MRPRQWEEMRNRHLALRSRAGPKGSGHMAPTPQLDCSSEFPLTVLVFPWQQLAQETSEPEALSEKKLETLLCSLFLATATRELTASLWEGAGGRSNGLPESHSKPTEVFRISTLQ